MKHFLKGIVVSILARQVRLLRKKHHFKIIGVVGGIGKTSTKLAIAQSLGKTLRVRYQEGNYMEYFNDMQAVSSEELSVAGYSEKLIYNADLLAEDYRQPNREQMKQKLNNFPA
jgi:molybdopterin-biosynthesis enzyme MoeA-like protein